MALFLLGWLCVLSFSCSSEAPTEDVAVAGLPTDELIGLLAHSDAQTRASAYQELRRYLEVETDAGEFSQRLTLFHKHAPHACKAEHEEQTLHILRLFEAQQDVSSILVKQCLKSKHAKVRAVALEMAHLSDNSLDEVLLVFEPDAATLGSYKAALRKIATPAAERRLAAVAED